MQKVVTPSLISSCFMARMKKFKKEKYHIIEKLPKFVEHSQSSKYETIITKSFYEHMFQVSKLYLIINSIRGL